MGIPQIIQVMDDHDLALSIEARSNLGDPHFKKPPFRYLSSF